MVSSMKLNSSGWLERSLSYSPTAKDDGERALARCGWTSCTSCVSLSFLTDEAWHQWYCSDESHHKADSQEEGERYRFPDPNPKATRYRQTERFQGLIWMEVIEVIPLNCVLLSIGVCPFCRP